MQKVHKRHFSDFEKNDFKLLRTRVCYGRDAPFFVGLMLILRQNDAHHVEYVTKHMDLRSF